MTDSPSDTSVDRSPAAARLVPVADSVHAWMQPDGSWWINNAGVVVDGGRAVVVDTCATETRTRRFLSSFDEAPVMAVNTHQHGDHTYGNCLLPETCTIVGTQAMRDGLAEDTVIDGCPPLWSPVPDWGAVTKRVPDEVFTGVLTFQLGEVAVEAHEIGYAAHTTGDAVVWVPEQRVLFTGDLLFHGLTPLVFMGSVAGARRALEWIASFEPLVVVPGHGPLVDDLDRVLGEHDRYYAFVESLVAEGVSPLDSARGADLGEFAGWGESERLVPNLHRAYADRFGTPVDVPTALVEACAWKGGPMETAV